MFYSYRQIVARLEYWERQEVDAELMGVTSWRDHCRERSRYWNEILHRSGYEVSVSDTF